MPRPSITSFRASLVGLLCLTMAASLHAADPVVNGSFEVPVLAPGAYSGNGVVDVWTFTGSAQISSNGNAYGNANAPDGVQVLILQGSGGVAASMSQSMTVTAGRYVVSFQAARRGAQIQPLQISIDGIRTGAEVTPTSSAFATYRSEPFTIATTGAHTLTMTTMINGGDATTFVDMVSLVPDALVLTAVANGSFETPSGTNYNPAGAGWVFVDQAGIQQNGGPFASANAPDGIQTAFLQSNGTPGSMSRSVVFAAGTCAVRFQAAQRNGYSPQPVQVSLDGTPVGSPIVPRGNRFEEYVTDAFVVTAGAHTLTLTATDATGDKITFIDAVSIETVDRFWVGGTGANWSTAANWASTSGGSDAVTVPDAHNAVTFDGGAACTLDVDATVGSLTCTGACSATLTFAAGKTLSITGNADLRSGAGTPFAGTGILAMSGSAAHTLTPPAAGKPLPALRLAGPGVTTLSGNPLVCTGTLTLESGTAFDWGAQTSVSAGSVVVDGAIAAYDSRAAFANATGAQTVYPFSGPNTDYGGAFDIGGGSGVPFGATVTGGYKRVADWIGGPQMPGFLYRFTAADGTYPGEDGYLVTLTPSAGVAGIGFDLCGIGFPFSRVEVFASDGSTQCFDFSASVRLDNTTYPMFRGFRAPAGTTITKIEFPQNGVPAAGFGPCWLDNLTLAPANPALALTIPAGKTLTTTGSGTTLTVPSDVTLVNQGTLSLSGTTFAVAGSTDFATSANTVVYTGNPSDTTAVSLLPGPYRHLTVNKAATTFNQSAAALSVAGNLSITAGTLASGGQNLNVAGDWSNAGTYTAGANTVTLNGAGASTQVLAGNTTFNHLTATCAAARTLNFTAGSTQTIDGTLTLTGASGQLLSLRSTVDTSTWTLTPNGTKTCSFVDVKDGTNTVGPFINPSFSVNSGNNTLWFGTNRYWVAAGPGNWNDTANWSTTSGGASGASVPSVTDAVIFDGGGLGGCTLDISASITSLSMSAGFIGGMAFGTNTLTVAGSADLRSVLPENFFNVLYTGSRNDFSGNVGYEFTPTSTMTIVALGRPVSGSMLGNHPIKVWLASDQSLVASVTVTPASPVDALGCKFETLAVPVTLQGGVTYRISSLETSGGDAWMNVGNISNHGAQATISMASWGSGDVYPVNSGGGGELGYVAPTFYVAQSPFSGTTGGLVVSANSTLTPPAFGTIPNLIVTSGTATLATNALSIAGNLTISGGNLTANGRSISVAGNWANSVGAGGFTAGTGTVTLNGAGGSTQVISGSTTFDSLTATCTTARTLNFTAGTTQTIGGTLTLTGASGQLLSLRSTAPTSTWTLTPNGTRTCSYVDVRDGINTVGPAINPLYSVNSGNTTLWFGTDRYWVANQSSPLDSVSASPAAAYGLRKLRAAYAGSAIRVRRSSDNTELDVGFAANGDLDASALTTFVAAGSGYVTTWYDQSGNGRNATQATLGNQPRLVNAGTIDTQNGRPAVIFLGGQGLPTSLSNVQATGSGTDTTICAVLRTDNGVMQALLGDSQSPGNRFIVHAPWSDGNTYVDIGNDTTARFSGALTWPTLAVGIFRRAGGQGDVWKNGTLGLTASGLSGGVGATQNICIGAQDVTLANPMQGHLAELVIFPSALSTVDRQTLEGLQSRYFAPNPADWSDPVNWAYNSGGAGGATVPLANETVHFDGAGIASCTVDVAASAASVVMTNGYTGALAFGTNTLTVAGNADLRSGGTFTGSTGGLAMSATGSLSPPAATTIPNLTVTGGTTTLATNNLAVASNLTISGGNLTANGRNISVAGNWANSIGAGGFTAGTGTVTLNGAGGTTQVISGSTTFDSLTATCTTARTLNFTAGTTQTIGGTLTLTGASGRLLSLRSTTPTSTWTLTPTGTRSCSYVDVSDGVNTTSPAINPTGFSRDSGNTTLWFGTDRYWTPSVASPLDRMTAQTAAAYGLRMLRAAYAGPLVRVRRSSDDTEQDISATVSGGLDLAALATFVGANSGYVSIWYDQSGSGFNAVQATLVNQPRLVNAGTVELLGGKPAIRFSGQPITLGTATVPVTIYPISLTTVAQVAGATNGSFIKLGDIDGIGLGVGNGDFDTSGIQFIGIKENVSWDVSSYTLTAGVPALLGYIVPGSGASTFLFNSATSSGVGSSPLLPATRMNIGGYGGRSSACVIAEALVFGSALNSTDRQALFGRQGGYFAGTAYATPTDATSWSDSGNWSTTSGGGGGASVPTSANRVFFDGNGLGTCNLDVAGSAASVTMAAAYTSTVAFGTNTLTVAGNADLRSGGTFTGTTGGLALSATSTLTPPASATIPNLTISAGTTTLATNNLNVDNRLTLAGDIAFGGRDASVGALTVSGTAVLTVPSGRTLTVTGAHEADADSALELYWPGDEGSGTVVHDRSGHGCDAVFPQATYVVGRYGKAVSCAAGVTVTASPTPPASGDFSVSWWTNAPSLFNFNADLGWGWDTWRFHSSSSGQIYCGTDVSTRFVIPAQMVANTWQHWVYTLGGGTATLYLDGNVIGSGAQTASLGVGNFVAHDGCAFDDVRVWSRAISAAEVQAVEGPEALLLANGADLTVQGTLSLGGVFHGINGTWSNASGSTVVFTGRSDDTEVLLPNVSFHHLRFNNAGTTFTQSAALTVGGNCTISAGTLASAGLALGVAGNWANTGTYSGGGNTVTLTGAGGSTQVISGNTTFSGLSASCTTARTLEFTAGTTQTVGGTLALNGASGQLLSLRSTTSSNVWSLTPSGTRTCSFVDVMDATNTVAPAINPTFSVNSGNTTLWFGTDRYWVGDVRIPLDGISTPTVVAYGLRRLSTGYVGPAIRVRRSDTNAESDIGFDGAGNLDSGSLTTFVGPVSGYVTTWYDQSGNGRHAYQTIAGNQPRIVDAGAIEVVSGKPALRFITASSTMLKTTATSFIPATNTAVTTVQLTAVPSAYDTISIQTNQRMHSRLASSTSWGGYYGGDFPAGVTLAPGTPYVLTTAMTGGSYAAVFSTNGSPTLSTNGGEPTDTALSLGADPGFSRYVDGFIPEYVVFGAALAVGDQRHMETSQSVYYITSGLGFAWSNQANWAYTSGGSGEAPIPTTTDTIHFDGGGTASCLVDVAASAASAVMTSGYTGSLAFGTNNLTVAGSVDLRSGGTFSGSTGGLTLSATGTLTPPAAATIPSVTVTGGTTTLASNNLAVASDLTISGGNLTANGRNISVAGNWANTVGAGGFTAGTGTVSLNGAGGSTQVISGNTTFDSLTATCTTARTLNFTAGTTQIVGGTLTLIGSTGQLLSLRSTTPASVWTLTPSGTRTCSYVDVQDGTNTVGPAINPPASVNSGNTTLWFGTDRYWVAPSAAPPLDAVSASPTATYGLRKLRTAYAGSAIRVRRSSDDAEQDIGFAASNDLDTVALTAFVGVNSGYVKIWYDQSGNGRDASQTSAVDQPRIVDAGTIETQGGRPAVRFFGSGNGRLSTASFTAYGAGWSSVSTAKVRVNLAGNKNTIVNKSAGYLPAPFDFHEAEVYYGRGAPYYQFYNLATPFDQAAGQAVYSFVHPASGIQSGFINGAANGSNTSSGNDDLGDPLTIGGRNDSFTALDGWISEVLTFGSAISVADRQSLEASQDGYFAISGAATAWSSQANWSYTSGGVSGAPVPTAANATYFNGGSTVTCDVDVAATAASITMGNSYTGILAFGNNTLTVAGNADLRSGGTFTGSTGGIVLSASSTLIPPAATTLPNVTVTTGTTTLANNHLSVAGTLSISGGNLIANGRNISVAGNWANSVGAGGFSAGSGTVTLNGAGGSTQVISGNTTFDSLTASCTTQRTLQFSAGTTQIVGGTLTLNGVSGQQLRLRSTVDASTWTLTPSGSRNCSLIDVKDGTNTVGPAINPASSTDSGNTTLWFGADRYWVAGRVPLDAVAGRVSPTATYALRKLRATYAGAAIRVRRSSDNVEQDIGFAASGDLDSSALTTFVGANSGYVPTWYDQSGNGHDAAQAVAGNQPRIVDAGTIETQGGRPAVRFFGTGAGRLSTAPFTAYNGGWSSVETAKVRVDFASENTIVSKANSNLPAPFDHWENTVYFGNGGGYYVPYTLTTALNVAAGLATWSYVHPTTGTQSGFVNGIANGSGTSSGNGDSGTPLCLGGRNDSGTKLDGWISEVLTFGSVISVADRQYLEASQGTYFSIPGAVSAWSNPGNWSYTSGGAGGASIPTAADAIYFDANGADDCTVDVAANTANVTMVNGYTGALAFGTNTLTVAGSADLRSGGTFTGSTGGLVLNATGTLSPPAATTIPNLTVTGGTATLASNDLSVAGNLTISGGNLTANSRTISVAGSWTNSVGAGGFTADTGTVTLNGAGGSTQAISGNTTFYRITASGTLARTLEFAAGSTQTLTGALTLSGASGQLLALRSSIPGSAWSFDPQGARACAYVDVRDGTNLRLPLILPTSSVDNGGTTWWFGQTLALSWDGATSGAIEGQTSSVGWDLGSLAPGDVRTSGSGADAARVFAVRNSGDQPAQLTASASSTGWAIAPVAGYEQATVAIAPAATFTSLDTTTSPAGVVLQSNLTAGSSQLFRIRIGAPIATDQGGSPQTLTITLNASPPP